jgi:hypothetical protein
MAALSCVFITVRRLLLLSLLLLLFLVLDVCLRSVHTATASLTAVLLVTASFTASVHTTTTIVAFDFALTAAFVLAATTAYSFDYCSTDSSSSSCTVTVEFALFQRFPIASSACCYSLSA